MVASLDLHQIIHGAFWLICDCDVIELWLKCDWYVIEMWLKYDWDVIEIWLKCDWDVIEVWLRCDWDVIKIWLRCDWDTTDRKTVHIGELHQCYPLRIMIGHVIEVWSSMADRWSNTVFDFWGFSCKVQGKTSSNHSRDTSFWKCEDKMHN